jgi:hypothetical protein
VRLRLQSRGAQSSCKATETHRCRQDSADPMIRDETHNNTNIQTSTVIVSEVVLCFCKNGIFTSFLNETKPFHRVHFINYPLPRRERGREVRSSASLGSHGGDGVVGKNLY